jgi:hypothetical protein
MEMPADPRPVVRHEPLVVAIMNEHQLLGELRRALAQQRTGVSSGDPATLEAASHAVSRAILTLDEARRRREQLVELAGEGRPVRLEHIESVAGPVPGLAESRQALRAEAQAAIQELGETQELLQAAIRAGDAYLQSLFASVSAPAPAYPSGFPAQAPAGASAGLLLNRSA